MATGEGGGYSLAFDSVAQCQVTKVYMNQVGHGSHITEDPDLHLPP